jgi:hypothetical protein
MERRDRKSDSGDFALKKCRNPTEGERIHWKQVKPGTNILTRTAPERKTGATFQKGRAISMAA